MAGTREQENTCEVPVRGSSGQEAGGLLGADKQQARECPKDALSRKESGS